MTVDRTNLKPLGRSQRQIMDIVYRLGRATVAEVLAQLPGEPGSSTVRKQLNILEDKGYLRHETVKNQNVYFPTIGPEKARVSAMKHVLHTFFEGSVAKAFVSLLDASDSPLSDDEKHHITALIDRSREEGR